MMLQPVTSTRYDANDAVSKVVTLYDAHGKVVGMWSERTGRAMLGDAFYVREDADTAHERGDAHE